VSEGRPPLLGAINLADLLRTGTRTLLWTDPGIRGQRAWPVLCLIASTLVFIWHLQKYKTVPKPMTATSITAHC
jgi:hypothetical protein